MGNLTGSLQGHGTLTGQLTATMGLRGQFSNIRVVAGGVGKSTTGNVYTPYTVDEANGYAYIYDEPVEAQAGAEIFNSYDGVSEYGSDMNIATGLYSSASGFRTQAIGNYSKSEGWWTRATGQCSVASGLLSIASGNFAHAEGTRTVASINNAHSEGDSTVASGRQSHAEGNQTIASGFCAHAEGSQTEATNYYSHSEGWGTIAAGRNQTAMGKYNVSDTSSLLIVGNGTSKTKRSNAFKLDANGNGLFSGDVKATSNGSTISLIALNTSYAALSAAVEELKNQLNSIVNGNEVSY